MWLSKGAGNFYGGGGHPVGGGDRRKGTTIVVVAIDKDKYSQHALKWAIEHLVSRGQTIVLIHVNHKTCAAGTRPDEASNLHNEKQIKELFLTFHCFCSRKHVQCIDVTLEDNNIAKALVEYASQVAIEYLVLGASSRNGFIRFKTTDVPTSVIKAAPDFCTIYVISKGKISSAKKSLKPAPFVSPLHEQIQEQSNTTVVTNNLSTIITTENSVQVKGIENLLPVQQKTQENPRAMLEELESFK